MKLYAYLLGFLKVWSLMAEVRGHARLLEPAGRSSLWRYGFDTPVNYDDNQLFCGGYRNTAIHEGKCGVCGDPFQGPFENEAGGKYARGFIHRFYGENESVIKATVDVSANHRGYFEFRLCPNNDVTKRVTQDCLDQHVLTIKEADKNNPTKFYPEENRVYDLELIIPDHIRCSQCVLQWKYTTGNFWGFAANGSSCMGCGPQELFINCADIAIADDTLFRKQNSSLSSQKMIKPPQSGSYGGSYANNVKPRVNTDMKFGMIGFSDDHKDGDYDVTIETQKLGSHGNHKESRDDKYKILQGTKDNDKLGSLVFVHNATRPGLNPHGYESHGNQDCGRCYALPTWKHYPNMDDWCDVNCKKGHCPPCRCYCGCPNLKIDNPCRGRSRYTKFKDIDGWCWRECCEKHCATDKCECSKEVTFPTNVGHFVRHQLFDVDVGVVFGDKNARSVKDNLKQDKKENDLSHRHGDVNETGTGVNGDRKFVMGAADDGFSLTDLFSSFFHPQRILLTGEIAPVKHVQVAKDDDRETHMIIHNGEDNDNISSKEGFRRIYNDTENNFDGNIIENTTELDNKGNIDDDKTSISPKLSSNHDEKYPIKGTNSDDREDIVPPSIPLELLPLSEEVTNHKHDVTKTVSKSPTTTPLTTEYLSSTLSAITSSPVTMLSTSTTTEFSSSVSGTDEKAHVAKDGQAGNDVRKYTKKAEDIDKNSVHFGHLPESSHKTRITFLHPHHGPHKKPTLGTREGGVRVDVRDKSAKARVLDIPKLLPPLVVVTARPRDPEEHVDSVSLSFADDNTSVAPLVMTSALTEQTTEIPQTTSGHPNKEDTQADDVELPPTDIPKMSRDMHTPEVSSDLQIQKQNKESEVVVLASDVTEGTQTPITGSQDNSHSHEERQHLMDNIRDLTKELQMIDSKVLRKEHEESEQLTILKAIAGMDGQGKHPSDESESRKENEEKPFLVDIRFMNNILSSIKSWFKTPLQIVD